LRLISAKYFTGDHSGCNSHSSCKGLVKASDPASRAGLMEDKVWFPLSSVNDSTACRRHDFNQTGANSLVQTSFQSLFRLIGVDSDHGLVCYPVWKSGAENRFPLALESPLCVHYLLRA